MDEEAKKVFYERGREDGADIDGLYTGIAEHYEDLLVKYGSVTGIELTNLVISHFPDKEVRPTLKIYEVGIGTGKIGDRLAEAGFADFSGS